MSFNRCFGAVVYAGFVVGWGGFCWAQIAIARRMMSEMRSPFRWQKAVKRSYPVGNRPAYCHKNLQLLVTFALPGNAGAEALPPLISQLKGERNVGGV